MIDREFLRGFVKLYALWRASKRDMYGLAVLQDLEVLGFKLSPGTLYPALHRLLRERDVVVRRKVVAGRVRKCYRLTPKGRAELKDVKEKLRVLVARVFH